MVNTLIILIDIILIFFQLLQ